MKLTDKKTIWKLLFGSLMLIMFAGCGSGSQNGDDTGTPVKSVDKTQEWYMRLIAEVPSENLKDKNNVLGRINGSSESYDRYDLLEINPKMADSAYLTIVFPHDDWEAGKNYASDYHGLSDVDHDEWAFVVRSSAAHAEVKMSWDGIFLLDVVTDENRSYYDQKQSRDHEYLDMMYLVDVDNNASHKVYQEGRMQSYSFSMAGKTERSFKWVLDFAGNYDLPEAAEPLPMTAKEVKTQSMKRVYREGELGTPPGT